EARSNTPVTELDLRSFSDSIVLSAPLVPDAVVKLVLSVVGLQRIFTRRSVLVRGGIAMGKHFADQDSIYSEALVRAYRLEHEHARFPRIIYDIDLLDWFMNDEACSQESKAKVAELLLRDRDGKIFSHYLCPDLIAVHADLISSYQSQKVTASVLEKVQWLASYHNHAAASIPNAAHVG